jgi:transposase
MRFGHDDASDTRRIRMRKASKKTTQKVNKKSRKREKSFADQKLDMINPNAAGIDVASEEMWVCVPADRAEVHIRKFGAFTCDLYEIADWLKDCGVLSVAMESTGIYWIPLYQVLEERGFEVCLVNARQMKNVSGRPKTDRLDCSWIQRLHSYGLLMPSFRPDDEICQLRSLLRHRGSLIQSAAREIQHMQKALHQMNLLLDKVISDITGVTGTAIIEQILAGERDPATLAKLRDCRIRATEDEICKALQGDYRDEHLFVLRQAYEAYQFTQQQIDACDAKAEMWLKKTEKTLDIREHPLPSEKPQPKKRGDNDPNYDARSYVYQIYGIDLTQIPGFGASTLQILLSEVGRDLTKWPTAKHFTSWLGLCPNLKRSGGKDQSSQTRKVKSRAARALRLAAQTLRNSKSALGAFYRRLASRLGPSKALTATARKLAIIFYNMVRFKTAYTDLGAAEYDKRQRQRHLSRLKKQAARLGFTLVPDAASANQA